MVATGAPGYDQQKVYVETNMLCLSEILLSQHEIETFEQLIPLIRARARGGERFFQMDVKPPFPDTPEDWEDRLEAAFNGTLRD